MLKTTTLVLAASALALLAATSFASAGSIIAIRSIGSSGMHFTPSLNVASVGATRAIVDPNVRKAQGTMVDQNFRNGGDGMLLPAVKSASHLKGPKHRGRGGVKAGYDFKTHKAV
jgi:hypothetical protein